MQIENFSTNPNSCVLNLDSIDLASEKSEIDIISNAVKKAFPKASKTTKLTNIETEAANINNNNLAGGEYLNTLLNKKDDPKIKKRLNLISSLDNYENVNFNTCLTEENFASNKLDREYVAQKKNEIRESISKKLNSDNNCHNNKLRRIMEQTSTLFDNKLYESNYSGIKTLKKLFFKF